MKPRDKVFLYVLGALFLFMILFGVAAFVLSLNREPSDQVTFRVLSAIGSMFGAVIGVVLGYLVGRNGNGNGGKDA